MSLDRREFALAAASILAAGSAAARSASPIIIGLGGTDDVAPATTRNDLLDAIQAGADYLGTNLLESQDGALVAAGERDLATFTDIAGQSGFASRKTTKPILGVTRSTWFLEDFTLDELRKLAVVPLGRRARRANGSILTLEDVIDIARTASARLARVVGLCVGLSQRDDTGGSEVPIEGRLAEAIRATGYNSPAAAMIVQSVDVEALKSLRSQCRARLVQRLSTNSGLLDEMASESGLDAIRTYADGVAPDIEMLGLNSTTTAVSLLQQRCQAAGLSVYAWAPASARQSHDLEKRLAQMFRLGLDGVATNDPQVAAKARRIAVGS